jgi:TRAP-type C4-dicarboxylate transport system permease large subunit
MCLFAVASFSKVSLGELSREIWPYLVGVFIVTLMVAYIPAIGTLLPKLLQ